MDHWEKSGNASSTNANSTDTNLNTGLNTDLSTKLCTDSSTDLSTHPSINLGTSESLSPSPSPSPSKSTNPNESTDHTETHNWEPSSEISSLPTSGSIKSGFDPLFPPLLGSGNPAFDKVDTQRQSSTGSSSIDEERDDLREHQQRELPLVTLGTEHGVVHEGARWGKYPPLTLEFPPVLRPLGAEMFYGQAPELFLYPMRYDGFVSPPISRIHVPVQDPVFSIAKKAEKHESCCVAQPELIKRRSKAFLSDEYLTSHLPNDDGVYETIVRQYLLPFCSFNYLGLEFFKRQKQLGTIDTTEEFELNYRSTIPECRDDDPGRFHEVLPRNMNFYEPKVFWCHQNSSNRRRGRNGLCPYCRINQSGHRLDLDRLFFNMNTSAYLHHVTKQHGIYSNGTEMPLPSAIGNVLEIKEMKSGRKCGLVDAVTCPICHEMVKIQRLNDPTLIGQNHFLAYFRHMLTHNKKKKNGVCY